MYNLESQKFVSAGGQFYYNRRLDVKFNPFTSKSVWGAITWAIGFLLQPGILSALPEKWAAVIQAVGVVLGVYGIRSGVAKASQGIVQLHWSPVLALVTLLVSGSRLSGTLPSPFPLTLAPDEFYGNAAGDS